MILSEIEIPQLDAAIGARGYALEIGAAARDLPPHIAAILCQWQIGQSIAAGSVPRIALTSNRATLIAALDAGASDAVAVPVDPDELAARVDARVRRHAASMVTVGPLTLDPVARSATRSGTAIALVAREFALLRYLAEHAGRFVSRRELLEQVWGLRLDPGTNVVAVHVSTLRAKLDRPFPTALIQGRKGLGYRLVAS
ncbi:MULTISPECIES: response regulator transcription factor [unclassified Sphingomonas]|uniref:response regulator transcription factor n=1 Tax=unclassified Sphingomonas TaxID=196159 RepID=UPI000A7B7B9B|nr:MULTISPECIES: response regulator transcription factor [unclassified Sphingomonas]